MNLLQSIPDEIIQAIGSAMVIIGLALLVYGFWIMIGALLIPNINIHH